MNGYKVREAQESDCEAIIKLIKELAIYEKYDTETTVLLTADVLREDGFGENKYYHCMVAQTDGDSPRVVGYALYFFAYSTWTGKMLYLEDLYVQEQHRKQGIGKALWKSVAQFAVERKCSRMDWVVLNWNASSIEFYKSKGAYDLTTKENWHLFRMEYNELEKLAASN